MRARPGLVSVSFLTLALVHAWWGVKVLLASNTLMGGSQLMSAGGFLLAAVAARERGTLSTALAIASAATALRLFALFPPGPFFFATAMLAGGLALAAWSLRRLDSAPLAGWEALPLRGGLVILGLSYFAILGAGVANSGNPPTLASADLVVRAIAAFVAAIYVEAPPVVLARRKPFDADAASAAR